MLKMIILSLEDFVLNINQTILMDVLKQMAASLNKELDDKKLFKFIQIFEEKGEENAAEKFYKELTKEWDVDQQTLTDKFYELGKQFFQTHQYELSSEWIEAFQSFSNHSIKCQIISLFDITKNPFSNFTLPENVSQIIQVKQNHEPQEFKDIFLKMINDANAQPSEVLLITNREKLFSLAEDIGINIFTSNQNIPKSYAKSNLVLQITDTINVESWIYQFLSKNTDEFI